MKKFLKVLGIICGGFILIAIVAAFDGVRAWENWQ